MSGLKTPFGQLSPKKDDPNAGAEAHGTVGAALSYRRRAPSFGKCLRWATLDLSSAGRTYARNLRALLADCDGRELHLGQAPTAGRPAALMSGS